MRSEGVVVVEGATSRRTMSVVRSMATFPFLPVFRRDNVSKDHECGPQHGNISVSASLSATWTPLEARLLDLKYLHTISCSQGVGVIWDFILTESHLILSAPGP